MKDLRVCVFQAFMALPSLKSSPVNQNKYAVRIIIVKQIAFRIPSRAINSILFTK